MTSPMLDNVAVLIPILSEAFVKSTTCIEHLSRFSEATKNAPHRIFKVGKFPVALNEQPELLRPLIGHDLYQLDPDSS